MKVLSTKKEVAKYIAKLIVDIESGSVKMYVGEGSDKGRYYFEQAAALRILASRMGIPKEVDLAVAEIRRGKK